VRTDSYDLRSGYSPALCIMWHLFVANTWQPIGKIDDRNFNFERMRKLLEEYVAIRPYFYADYYPLSPYSVAADVWMAWQFDRPERSDGLIQAFRRAACKDNAIRVNLHSLEPDAVYIVADHDVAGTTEMTGRELMETGLTIAVKDQPGAAVITYRKKP